MTQGKYRTSTEPHPIHLSSVVFHLTLFSLVPIDSRSFDHLTELRLSVPEQQKDKIVVRLSAPDPRHVRPKFKEPPPPEVKVPTGELPKEMQDWLAAKAKPDPRKITPKFQEPPLPEYKRTYHMERSCRREQLMCIHTTECYHVASLSLSLSFTNRSRFGTDSKRSGCSVGKTKESLSSFSRASATNVQALHS